MRLIKLFLVIFVISVKSVSAQSVQDVFNQKEMTWYGLDFSMAKFVGDFSHFNSAGTKAGSQIRDTYFKSWNHIIVGERDKYDFLKFYKKEALMVDLESVEKINAKVDADKMMVWNTPEPLNEEKIQEAVHKYTKNEKSGLGLVFVVESFDKLAELASIHVTFFDIATGKILLTKKLQTKPRGFGLRNYWVGTAYSAMEESKKNWKNWKKEAGIK